MGSWGHEPCSSDAAYDMLDTFVQRSWSDLNVLFGVKVAKGSTFRLQRHGVQARRHSLDTWGRWSRLGIAQILSEQWHVPISIEVARQCLTDLELVAQDAEFVSGWRDPLEFMKLVRACWGWLADALERAEERNAEATKRNKVRSKAKTPRRRSRSFVSTSIYGPIFGPATRLGCEGRHKVGVKRKTMPDELAAALRKTLKAALVMRIERREITVSLRGARRIRRTRAKRKSPA